MPAQQRAAAASGRDGAEYHAFDFDIAGTVSPLPIRSGFKTYDIFEGVDYMSPNTFNESAAILRSRRASRRMPCAGFGAPLVQTSSYHSASAEARRLDFLPPRLGQPARQSATAHARISAPIARKRNGEMRTLLGFFRYWRRAAGRLAQRYCAQMLFMFQRSLGMHMGQQRQCLYTCWK